MPWTVQGFDHAISRVCPCMQGSTNDLRLSEDFMLQCVGTQNSISSTKTYFKKWGAKIIRGAPLEMGGGGGGDNCKFL